MSNSLKDLLTSMASCSACGQCLDFCPVYAQSGIETDSPRGKLRIAIGLMEGAIEPESALPAISRCALCGRCSRACPQAVPLQAVFFAARRFLVPHLPAWRKGLIWSLTKASRAWDFCQPPLHLLQKLRPSQLPRVSFSPFASNEHGQGAILLFGGCLARRFFPELIADSIRALEAQGHTVIWEGGLVCCGRPQAMQGRDIKAAVRKNLGMISRYDFSLLTGPCPGCLATVKHIWSALAGLTPDEQALCKSVAARVIDINILLIQTGAKVRDRNVFWHAPCLLDVEADKAARRLAGAASASSQKPSCCGSPLHLLKTKAAKSGNRLEDLLKPVKLPLQEKLKKSVLNQATGAGCIATACPGCMLALRGDTPVRHAVQICCDEPD